MYHPLVINIHDHSAEFIFFSRMGCMFLQTPDDTIKVIKKQSDFDYDVKCTTIMFHDNIHNSQSSRWIGLTLYVESPNMLSYLGLKF